MIEIEAVSPTDEDARLLLAAYVEELDRRLPEGASDVAPTWDAGEYGGLRGRIAVARLDGEAIGCAGLREFEPAAAELKRLYVARLARRRGVARGLLGWMEQSARELGYRRIVLDTALPLVEAARLYETGGYAEVGAFNDNPHATHWFEKVFPLDDVALWGAFRHATLPEAEWTHRSHIRTGYLFLGRSNLDEAHLRMRVGIIRLNARHGLEETPKRGYHETLTRAWLALIDGARRGEASMTSEAFLTAHPELLDKELTLRFYSRERLLSLRARTVFVEPDLGIFPGL